MVKDALSADKPHLIEISQRHALVQLLGQELVPGPDPCGVRRLREKSAVAYGLACGYRNRHYPFALMGGRQVATEQVIPARYFRSRHVRGPAARCNRG